jgi:hypothetical protein
MAQAKCLNECRNELGGGGGGGSGGGGMVNV